MGKRIKPIDNFLSKVVIQPGCWDWKGKIHKKTGYSEFKAQNTWYVAHRFAYQFFVSSIPPAYVVHHKCENRKCSNPKHLEAMPARNHILLSDNPAGINARKTHCTHGHEFTPENTYIVPRNPHRASRRTCRICNHKRTQKYLHSH